MGISRVFLRLHSEQFESRFDLTLLMLFLRENKEDHHVVERTALPDHLIKNAQGQLAFEETLPRVRHTFHVWVKCFIYKHSSFIYILSIEVLPH